jgi:hypothetical protein
MSPLSDLHLLLENLPHMLPLLPLPEESDYAKLILPFELSLPVLQRTQGNKITALLETLASIFCQDGEVIISEHGEPLLAVANILEVYLLKYPNDCVLLNWVGILSQACKGLYKSNKSAVCYF